MSTTQSNGQIASNAERYNVRIAATFLSRSQSTALLTDHVSARGVFIRTDSPPPVMELLRIEFVLPPASTTVVMHGMVTELVLPQSKHSAPGVEIAFFAKGGEPGRIWDQFVRHVRDRYPESVSRPVTLAQQATDQVRRAHPRVVPATPIEVGSSHGPESMTVGDISDGGMFIRTSKSFTVGTDLRITLRDPRTHARIPVDCIVRRRAFGSNGGIGVEFRNVNDAQQAVLTELMRTAGPAHSVQAVCEEVLAPPVQRMMNTLPGPGRFGAAVSILPTAPGEDSWATLDEGWV
jgi:Tfp pilus assembly protein PilZ